MSTRPRAPLLRSGLASGRRAWGELRDLGRRMRGEAREGASAPVIGGPLGKVRMGVDVLGAKVAGRRRPLFVGWQLTDTCNLRCSYCGRWDLGRPELGHARMRALVDEMADAGLRRLSLTGGEPLVHPLCLELGARARARGVQVSLSTNGLLVARHIAALPAAVDTMVISIDGDRAHHEANRGEGSYDGAVEGAEHAVAAGIPVNLHCVVTRHNHHNVDAVLDLAGRLGGTAGFAPVGDVPAMGQRDVTGLKPAAAWWRDTVDHLLARKAAGDRRIQNSEAGLRYLRNWPVYAPITCSAGVVYARIEPDGQLYGCGNLVLGSGPRLDRQDFATAFAALPAQGCEDCWCDTRVEMNLVLMADPSALRAAFWR